RGPDEAGGAFLADLEETAERRGERRVVEVAPDGNRRGVDLLRDHEADAGHLRELRDDRVEPLALAAEGHVERVEVSRGPGERRALGDAGEAHWQVLLAPDDDAVAAL